MLVHNPRSRLTAPFQTFYEFTGLQTTHRYHCFPSPFALFLRAATYRE